MNRSDLHCCVFVYDLPDPTSQFCISQFCELVSDLRRISVGLHSLPLFPHLNDRCQTVSGRGWGGVEKGTECHLCRVSTVQSFDAKTAPPPTLHILITSHSSFFTHFKVVIITILSKSKKLNVKSSN